MVLIEIRVDHLSRHNRRERRTISTPRRHHSDGDKRMIYRGVTNKDRVVCRVPIDINLRGASLSGGLIRGARERAIRCSARIRDDACHCGLDQLKVARWRSRALPSA